MPVRAVRLHRTALRQPALATVVGIDVPGEYRGPARPVAAGRDQQRDRDHAPAERPEHGYEVERARKVIGSRKGPVMPALGFHAVSWPDGGAGEARGQRCEPVLQLGACERRAEAMMGAVAERHVRRVLVAGDVERLGTRERLAVVIGAPEREQERRALLETLAAVLERCGDRASDARHGGAEPQHLLHHVGHGDRAGCHAVPHVADASRARRSPSRAGSWSSRARRTRGRQ